jgi:3-hydroxybutyrate dehydrogenase
MSLAGQTAVVTGGGRGIGAAIAQSLAKEGAQILVAARTAQQVDRVAAALNKDGAKAKAFAGDVTDPASVRHMMETARKEFGKVDILVNNAGAATSAPLAKITLEEWNRILAANATSTFLCTQAVLPEMMERRHGRIVNIASVAARTGGRYIAAYAAAKHAVLGFTRSVALEAAEHGVTVNAICPGYVDTEMTRESLQRITEKTGLSREAALEKILKDSPQRRLISPEEVAHAVRMLCDHEARGINGQAIGIDGGELLS